METTTVETTDGCAARAARSERTKSARKSERGREGRKSSAVVTPGRGLRARASENVEKAPGGERSASKADTAKVPLQPNASSARKGRAVVSTSADVQRGGESKNNVESNERGGSTPRGADAGEDEATVSARTARVPASYADAQTPKNVKKIAWIEPAANERSVISAKKGPAPDSTAKSALESTREKSVAAKEAEPIDTTESEKIKGGQSQPSAGVPSEQKRRERKRANGLAFLNADIPALAAKNPQAGGAVVSTELKISPRALAARKAKEAKESADSVLPTAPTSASVESKENDDAPSTAAAPALGPRSVVPKAPVDQRSLTESFMIQPETVSSTVNLAPLSSLQKMVPTPSQIKAFQSLTTPSTLQSGRSAQGIKLPAAIAPVANAAEANDVMNRLKRAMEARSRADEENKRQLESALRQKEEERKRREKEMEVRKARHADEEAREREERRLRQERLAQFRLQEEEAQRKAAAEKNKWAKMLEEQKKAMYDISAKLAVPISLKKRTSGQAGFTTSSSEAEKRRRLLENAQAAIQGHSNQPQPSAGMRTPTRSIFRTNFATGAASTHRTPPAESYPISPYCSSDSEDDDRSNKQIPRWARGDALVPQLKAQSYVDPDDIFPNPSLTCSLGKIFAKKSSRDRRRSSSNWTHDRLTLQEELSYKQKMGFR